MKNFIGNLCHLLFKYNFIKCCQNNIASKIKNKLKYIGLKEFGQDPQKRVIID